MRSIRPLEVIVRLAGRRFSTDYNRRVSLNPRKRKGNVVFAGRGQVVRADVRGPRLVRGGFCVLM